jgi:hypothetical protein
VYPRDFAGNNLNNVSVSFTVAAGAADTTPPVVTSVTPPTGTTGVGQNTPVVITFSKPLNPNTISVNSFALFNGASRVGISVNRSADSRTVTLSGSFSPSSLVTVVITKDVMDLSGNQLADFTSQFTTAPTPASGSLSVVTQRPGNGATGVATNTSILLLTNQPVNIYAAIGAMHVSQNGVIVPGTVTVSANWQGLLFTPESTLTNNVTVQVFLDSTATDTSGNPATAYSGAFTTAPDLTDIGPTVAALSPTNSSTISITNPVVDIQFTKSVAAGTVTSANFFLSRFDSGDPIPSAVSQPYPNVVRITPAAPLDPSGNPYYHIHILADVTDDDGHAYAPTAYYYFYVAAAATDDTNAPTIIAVTPPEASTVGDNALIRVTFSEPMDPTTINATSVTVNGGVVPASFSFEGNNTSVVITPLATLPDNANFILTLNGGPGPAGIADPSGNFLVTRTIHFSTINGPDVTPPYVVASTVRYGQTVPSNTVFSLQFNEPMDTQSLSIQGSFDLYDPQVGYISVNRSFSADGLTATINPTIPLPVGRQLYLWANGRDLSGNTQAGYSIVFYASSVSETAPPTVLATNPGTAQTSVVPINTQLQVLFDRPVMEGTLSQITLTAGAPVTLTRSLTNGDQTVLLMPNSPLAPGTTYVLTVEGVKTIAGIEMAGPMVVVFTTGPGATLTNPTIVVTNPPDGAAGVDVSVAPTVRLSAPVNPVSAYGNVTLRLRNTNEVVASTLSYSSDYKTVTITPTVPLLAGTQYSINISGPNVTDQAGNPIQAGVIVYNFTTR